MKIEILSVNDKAFKEYGNVLEGYDFTDLFAACVKAAPMPEQGFTYQASVPEMETLPIADEIKNRVFGGLPIQFGFVSGSNDTLNCLEFHRSSELNIALNDIILLLGKVTEMEDSKFDTSKVKAFKVPAGTCVELFGTTLHYAPCDGEAGGYRIICVLPRGTNGDKPDFVAKTAEDRLCMGVNKWIMAHPDAPEAQNGIPVALLGENIVIRS